MTGFLRLGRQEICSPIEVKAAQVKLPDAPALELRRTWIDCDKWPRLSESPEPVLRSL